MKEEGSRIEKITELLPEGWREKARETGAITRSRKIKTPEELLRLNLLYQTSGGSFGKTSAMLKFTEENSLNKNAVYERILKSKEWLRWMCENTCRETGYLAPRPEWLEGKTVCLIDGTNESKRGSKQADFRLHYCMELFTVKMREMLLTEAVEGEKLSRFHNIGKNDVILADRMFGTLQGISHLIEKECEYVLRLKSGAFNLYDKTQEKVELSSYFDYLAENESGDGLFWYKKDNQYHQIRICAVRKTEEAVQTGITQIKKSNSKEKRGKVTQKQREYNHFIIVATNLFNQSATRIMELYRMRWQIELVFKRFKSIFNYDEMPSKLKDSAETWFYGKLLVAALCESLVNKGRFSPNPE